MTKLMVLVSVVGLAACSTGESVIMSQAVAAPTVAPVPVEEEPPTLEAPVSCTIGFVNFDVSTAATAPTNPARDVFHYVICPKGDGYACSWYWPAGRFGSTVPSGARVWECLAPNGQLCVAPCG